MPLYEARSYDTRAHLNKEQQKQAHRALYGLPDPSVMQAITPEEVEKMRELVLQHDVATKSETREFDLNNPPKQPYVHQELPRVVYHHAKRVSRVAHTEADLAAALENGWHKEPFPAEPPATEAAPQTKSAKSK